MCISSTLKVIKHQLRKLKKIHRGRREKEKTPPLRERYPIFMGWKSVVQIATQSLPKY